MHIFGVGGDQSTQHKCKQTEHEHSPQKGSVWPSWSSNKDFFFFAVRQKNQKESAVMYSNDPAQEPEYNDGILQVNQPIEHKWVIASLI